MATVASDRAQQGYALEADEGEAFWLFGMLQTIKIGQADTDGEYGLVEVVTPEGVGSPWHVHPEGDERFYVVGGARSARGGDVRLPLKAGSFASGPKGAPHSFYGPPGGARLLMGLAPMKFGGFQREVAESALGRFLRPPAGGLPDMAVLALI